MCSSGAKTKRLEGRSVLQKFTDTSHIHLAAKFITPRSTLWQQHHEFLITQVVAGNAHWVLGVKDAFNFLRIDLKITSIARVIWAASDNPSHPLAAVWLIVSARKL
jgi:hypothetical protein